MIARLRNIKVLRFIGRSMRLINLMNRKKDRKLERLNQIIEIIKNSMFTTNINRDKRIISMITVISMKLIKGGQGQLIKNIVIKNMTKNIDTNVDHVQKFINLKINLTKDIM